MDGAAPLTPQVAEAKAVGAAMLHRDGASLGELAKDRPGFFSVADRLVRVPIVPGLGSVLIKREGKVLGAVGVSGGRPEQDLEGPEAGHSSTRSTPAAPTPHPPPPTGPPSQHPLPPPPPPHPP